MRPWRAEDASALHPILVANWKHLGPWIPARVATPVPVPELEVRLAGFGDDFASGREFRYGLFAPDGHEPVSATVELTSATFAAVALIAMVPVTSGVGRLLTPLAPKDSPTR